MILSKTLLLNRKDKKRMRQLMYECYKANKHVKTVPTLKEAMIWKADNKSNSYKETLIEIEKRETKEEKEKRLARIAKIRKTP